MQVAPVSADLLIKLGIGVAVLGAGAWMVYNLKQSISNGAGTFTDFVDSAVDAVNPNSTQNIVYRGTNAVFETVLPSTAPGTNADGSWTLGGWAYDVLNPGVAYLRDHQNTPPPKRTYDYNF